MRRRWCSWLHCNDGGGHHRNDGGRHRNNGAASWGSVAAETPHLGRASVNQLFGRAATGSLISLASAESLVNEGVRRSARSTPAEAARTRNAVVFKLTAPKCRNEPSPEAQQDKVLQLRR